VAVPASLAGEWTGRAEREELAAPSLLWSETTSSLRQLVYRGEADDDVVRRAIRWLSAAEISVHSSRDLLADAYELASRLGWKRTYDAEYVVLARRLNAPLVTADARLFRGAGSLIRVLGPEDL
jgi:predicted nucleic acid-binding protein